MTFDSTDTGRHNRTVSAFFDTHGAAQKATDDLIAAGIPRDRIALTAGQDAGAAATTVDTSDDKGFWASLKELFLPDEDRNTYAEGLRRGGYLLAVRVGDADHDRVLDIMDTDGAVNMEERETEWRSQGWSGFSGQVESPGTGDISTGLLAADHDAAIMASTPVSTMAGTGEENFWAGRRDLDRGRARVRSYAAEGATLSTGTQPFSAATDRAKIVEHMDVIASEGTKIGTVDHLEGLDQIKLAKDTAPDGQHHMIPLVWVDHVDAHVHLNRTSAEAKAAW